MKCEYCENELPSNATDICPFCGASRIVEETSCEQTPEDEIIDVICPHCRTVYTISPCEWGANRECEVCHESFPLTYGSLSPEQTSLIWKCRIIGIVAEWRNGKDALFSARQYVDDVVFKKDEVLYERVEKVILSESRGVRRTISERSSNRFYGHDFFDNKLRRTDENYTYEGRSETATNYEYRRLDSGVLYLTSQRMLFVGNQMQRYVNLDKITVFVPDFAGKGEIRIAEDSKQKVLRFSISAYDEDEMYDEGDDFLFRFSLVLKALRDIRFKRFLLAAPVDEVATYFMENFTEYPYFNQLIPQGAQLPQDISNAKIINAPVIFLRFLASLLIGICRFAKGILIGIFRSIPDVFTFIMGAITLILNALVIVLKVIRFIICFVFDRIPRM